MKVTFRRCQRITPERDGIDFIFHYQTDADQLDHKFHVVTTTYIAPTAWYMEPDALKHFSEATFTAVISFFKEYWRTNRRLPDEKKEYFIEDQFAIQLEQQTSYLDYVLALPD